MNHGRTDGQRHGRTTRKHIASAGAYRRRRLNKTGTWHICYKTTFHLLATPEWIHYNTHNITDITYCNEALHSWHRVAQMVQQILCRQQIGAVFPIDKKLLLVCDEAVSNRVYWLFIGGHNQILWKLTVHFIEFLINIKATNLTSIICSAATWRNIIINKLTYDTTSIHPSINPSINQSICQLVIINQSMTTKI